MYNHHDIKYHYASTVVLQYILTLFTSDSMQHSGPVHLSISRAYTVQLIYNIFYSCSHLMVCSILDNHPGLVHFSVSRAHVSCSLIPVPHILSCVASARILGVVVFSMESNGGFCRNFSRIQSKHFS